ncbi:alpha/beta hydrolase family protein [Streptomyces venezuelae]|uniref:alpha/beta hydrolase family protein n=1 Tax=Streptomyces venezuelae TaxID=54571 RepID=UPI001CC2699A|nr:alpha/beta hydrolase [Streptomyces venezuelae]
MGEKSVLSLPAPAGRFGVGLDTLHLVDRERTDPWVASGPRELMVTLRYPARRGTGAPVGYLRTDEARLLIEDRGLEGMVAPEVLAGTKSSSRAGALPRVGRFPLVVLSPGFTVPRASLTALAEDLASRGYVVASVDHAYEASGVAFPGGRMLTCRACEQMKEKEDYRKVSDGRARDVSFLLDRLTGRHPAWRHAWMIDERRIGMAGHSIGGAGTAAAMAADRRIRAGADLDGTLFTPVPENGLDGRPFLLMGTAEDDPEHYENWAGNFGRLDGWKRWLTVEGSGHFTFTDFPVLGEQLGLPDPEVPLSGTRSVALTRKYVAAFFDLQLKGVPQPLLDGPSADNPEVRFHTP